MDSEVLEEAALSWTDPSSDRTEPESVIHKNTTTLSFLTFSFRNNDANLFIFINYFK